MNDNLGGLPVSVQLGRLRRRRGLTLEEVAERAGTSAPTIHRYESGWNRFELRTLWRIGAALDAGLEVRLVPGRSDRVDAPTPEDLRETLAPLFWDTELAVSHFHEHPGWVLARVLVFGNLDQVRAARAFFGDDALLAAVRRRGVDERTRVFWTTMLEATCTRAS